MTHVFTDEGYQEYQKNMAELEELKHWKDRVVSNAAEYVKDNDICWHKEQEPYYESYCDDCPPALIFYDCPLGRDWGFSK